MEKEKQKINSLLKTYKKEEVKITLKIKNSSHKTIRGLIIKKGFFPYRFIIIKSENKSLIKIFQEDILLESIIPSDYEKKENKNQRSNLSKGLRHKVLTRDRRTCTGCGAQAPDVQLEVDHIIPVSKGGSDELQNLTTLCFDCNRGKGDKQ